MGKLFALTDMKKNVVLKGYRKLRPNEILRKGDIFLDRGEKITETMISGNPVDTISIFYYRKIVPKSKKIAPKLPNDIKYDIEYYRECLESLYPNWKFEIKVKKN